MAAKLICVLIAFALILVIYAVVRSFSDQTVTTPRGSQSLPEQAAHGSGSGDGLRDR